MAGQELVTEGFKEGQVGSSAMPHKMNTRSCERVNGLMVTLRGYASMAGELAGDQWNEGDVSCSVVRRVALPDAFFAFDGMLETFLTVLDEFGVFPAVVARELDRYLPFLATTKVLMGAVRAGVGREVAHEAIKEHAVAAALAMREGAEHNELLDRLAADSRIPLDRARAGRADGGPAVVHRRGGRADHGDRQPRAGGRRAAPRRRRLPARSDPLTPRFTARELAAARGKQVPDVAAEGAAGAVLRYQPRAALRRHRPPLRPARQPVLARAARLGVHPPRRLLPEEERELLAHGLGITNVVARATARADELTRAEFAEGGRLLEAKTARLRPKWLAVLGVTAYRAAFDVPGAAVGPQERLVGGVPVWLLPNPSGLNAHYTPSALAEKFGELRAASAED